MLLCFVYCAGSVFPEFCTACVVHRTVTFVQDYSNLDPSYCGIVSVLDGSMDEKPIFSSHAVFSFSMLFQLFRLVLMAKHCSSASVYSPLKFKF
jgi:hypothetical protein